MTQIGGKQGNCVLLQFFVTSDLFFCWKVGRSREVPLANWWANMKEVVLVKCTHARPRLENGAAAGSMGKTGATRYILDDTMVPLFNFLILVIVL